MAHLVFALHFVSFQYLATILIAMSRDCTCRDLVPTIGVCLIAAYLVLALKRVYGGTTTWTLIRAAALFALTRAVNFAASITAIRLTLLLV